MEAVVHLDRSATMPSQSQMAYSRPTTLHGRPSQPSELCYKPNNSTPGNHGGPSNPAAQSLISSSSGSIQRHSPATYSSVSGSYQSIRFMHAPSYAPNPGGPGSAPGPPLPYRDSIYLTRNSNVVSDRGQPVLEYGMRGENMPSQSKPRISLLTSPEYISSLSNRRHHQEDSYRGPIFPQNVQPLEVNTSFKKIRLGDSKSDIQRTLRIDTRGHSKQDGQSSTIYTPQVEAISPTLPTEVLQDENFRSTKDELLHGISKFDREITKTELQISKLMRKQHELEEAAKKPVKQAEEEEVPQPKHQSPAQKIYAENRRKAQEAHGLLKHLGPAVQLPIYNQPSDTAVYHENKMKHQMFKDRLMVYLKKKHIEREMREKRLTATYSVRVQEWLRKVDKVENSQKRKAREMKNREFFEKVFPRLRKQREDRERFNRVGARVKSEADLEEIMDGLQEQEMEDKKMRSYAVVPPLLLDAEQRSVSYINNNGRVDDFPAEYKERHLLNVWTQSEKDIFKEKFLQHPKNFGVIASYLEKKSVSDCVQYYYLSKKTENYKRLLRKSRVRSRSGKNPQAKVSAGAVSTNNSDLLSTATGVTTRFQREQLQKQEPIASTSTAEIRPPLIIEAEANPPPANFMHEESPPSQPPPLLLEHTEAEKLEEESKEPTAKKKKPKVDPETSDDDQYEHHDDDTREHSGNFVECSVCKMASNLTRALPKSQASLYGLKEDDVAADARVCNLCRCKAVRSRFTHCPVPTCPNAKMQRVKRLRHLPIKWVDITPSIREQLSSEFGVEESLTKCCSLCYNRIIRKISASMDISPFITAKGKMSQARCSIVNWSDEEIQKFKDGLQMFGINWAMIADLIGGNKTLDQCMTFFYKYMRKLNLDHHLAPGIKESVLEERKPVLTDEEESGSSTSSCDEVEGTHVDGAADSDTTSAPSPSQNAGSIEDGNKESSITPPPQLIEEGRITAPNADSLERMASQQGSPQSSKGSGTASLLPPVLVPNKEDYDSSATETADEGQGGGETEPVGSVEPHPKREEEPPSPLTVKDLMLNVIEMQLLKNRSQTPSSSNPSGPPTISSILKSNSSISYSHRDRTPSARPNTDTNNSLATVSVVSSHHSHQPPPQDLRKEGLVVVQIPQAVRETNREPEGVTLDLSIKKPRDSSQALPSQLQSTKLVHQTSHPVFRVAQPNSQQTQIAAQLQQSQVQSMQQSHNPQSHQSQQMSSESSGFFHQQILSPSLAPKLSPGVITGASANKPQCGSIIHGTPVSSPNIYNQARYEQQASTPIIIHTSPHKEPGSITQGTPVHQRGSLFPSNSESLFNKRMPPQGFYPPRPAAYNVEQRQIIMNDYITSQQMHAPPTSGSRNGRSSSSAGDKVFYQPAPGARQGVIQRHNTKPPSPGVNVNHHPPGYEAFSSLVDVASRQPSLPVPSQLSMQSMSTEMKGGHSEEKRHLHGEGLGERFNRDSPHERFSIRDADVHYIKENSKIHGQVSSDRREHQQQSSGLPLRGDPHPRESYSSAHHMEREMQTHQMAAAIRERDHLNHHAQKMREHQIHVQQQQQQQQQQHQQQREIDARMGRGMPQNYSQRIIHEPHVNIDQRLIQVQGYRSEQPSSSQSTASSSSSHTTSRKQQEQCPENPNVRGRPSDGSSTLTAASLIDAIITHQINRSSEGPTPPVPTGAQQGQHTRPGDRLFQSFYRECSESNGKISPMKSTLSIESKGQHSSSSSSGPSVSSEHVEMYGGQQTIRQGGPGAGVPSSMYQGGSSTGGGVGGGYDHQTWKLRRALQQKDMEQQQSQHEKAVAAAAEDQQQHIASRGYYTEPPVPLSPLDYVKNRIAEVMRTSEEDGGGGSAGSNTKCESPISPSDTVGGDESDQQSSQQPPSSGPPSSNAATVVAVSSSPYITPNPHAYAYPYSALSLTTGGGGTSTSSVNLAPQHVNKQGNESIPEPAPLLSAQYEPLSDED